MTSAKWYAHPHRPYKRSYPPGEPEPVRVWLGMTSSPTGTSQLDHRANRRTRRFSFFNFPFSILLLLLLTSTAAAQDPAPTFLIESFEVTGASSSAAQIVIAESRLREGHEYGEPELRDAIARIQRLPFVIGSDFRLAKGTSVGKYVLVISIRQMKPLFVNANALTLWSRQDLYGIPTPIGQPKIGELVDQSRTSEIAVGGRMFVGAKGMLNVAAQRVEDRNDRYTVAFSQYDLFGTRASVTAVASYLNDPGAGPARRVGVGRFDWKHRDNITWELIGVVPVGQNESLRFSWQRSERPIRYLELQPRQLVIRSLPQIRKEVTWIYDTTNDPLFPSSGTRISAGVSRTDAPTSGLTDLGRVKVDEYLASLERSWSLTSSQALTAGGSGADFDRSIRRYRAFGRYSVDLWGRERTIAAGDLRLEVEGDRLYTRIRNNHFEAHSTARVGLAYRNVWGVLRLDFAYNAWREP
jgi:hypothetical protein